jgi:hypothetical protein
MRPARTAKATHTLVAITLAPLNVSTSIFTPYCAPTEQATAAITAARMNPCGIARRFT